MSKAILVGLAIIMMGCAGGSMRQNDINQASWINHYASEMVAAFGAPTSTFRMHNGDVLYTWSSKSTRTVQSTIIQNPAIPGMTHIVGGGTRTRSCDRTWTVRNGIVIGWNQRGNNCGQ